MDGNPVVPTAATAADWIRTIEEAAVSGGFSLAAVRVVGIRVVAFIRGSNRKWSIAELHDRVGKWLPDNVPPETIAECHCLLDAACSRLAS